MYPRQGNRGNGFGGSPPRYPYPSQGMASRGGHWGRTTSRGRNIYRGRRGMAHHGTGGWRGRGQQNQHLRRMAGNYPPHPQFQPAQQQMDPRLLHTTAGRSWTMYQYKPQGAPESSAGSSRDATTAAGAAAHVGRRGAQLTVVSYNVLADSLISFEYIPYCRGWRDDVWKARPGQILSKILKFQPDVVCLQEVDETQYLEFFKPSLETNGYNGVYCKRSGDKVDGCATFVLGHSATLAGQEDVMYKVEGHPILDRDNVALLVVVDVHPPDPPVKLQSCGEAGKISSSERAKDKAPVSRDPTGGEISDHRVTAATSAGSVEADGNALDSEDSGVKHTAPVEGHKGARLVVANTHLLFNPKRGDVKMAQLMMLTQSVERLTESVRADGVIICGDFNMTPDSALYHYMINGELNLDGLSWFTMSGQNAPMRSQYQSMKEIGSLCNRSAGFKHQGGGCALGSFEQALKTSWGGGGRGRGGGRKRGRGGRNGGRLWDAQLCEACSCRPPYAAFSRYVAVPDENTDVCVDTPPGAPSGSLFAVMDPSPCSCKADGRDGGRARHHERARKAEDAGGRDGKGKGKVVGAGSYTGGARSTEAAKGNVDTDQLAPVLWPSKGANGALLRGLGPVVHRLRLRSAYAQQADAWSTGEPAFTSYHNSFKGTVDYVFYGPDYRRESDVRRGGANRADGRALEQAMPGRLRCLGVAEPPMQPELDRFKGIPSHNEPSDHILLAVRFEVTPP